MTTYVKREHVIVLLGCRHWWQTTAPPDMTLEDALRRLLAGDPSMPGLIYCSGCRTYRRVALDEIDGDPMILNGWELVRL